MLLLKDCIEHEKLAYLIVTMKLSFNLQIISLKEKSVFFPLCQSEEA